MCLTVHVVCKSAFLVTLVVKLHMTCLRGQAESWVLSLKQKGFYSTLGVCSSVKWVIVLLTIVVNLLHATRFLSPCPWNRAVWVQPVLAFTSFLFIWVVLLASWSVPSPPQLWHYDIKEESSSEGDHSWRLWVSFHMQRPCNKVMVTATLI